MLAWLGLVAGACGWGSWLGLMAVHWAGDALTDECLEPPYALWLQKCGKTTVICAVIRVLNACVGEVMAELGEALVQMS